MYIAVLMIDFSKAFDSVCHTTLTSKLKAMGISGDSLEWCIDYLSERKQFTTIQNEKSSLAAVDQGVPQGSLLGPRFYNFHANDLPDASGDHAEIEMFADDTTGYCYGSNVDSVMSNLQKLCNSLYKWAKRNGMVIHPGKTKTMLLSRKNFTGPLLDVAMDGKSIEVVHAHKILGVTIDHKLNWSEHVTKTMKSFSSKVKQLKQMQTLPKATLNKFYHAVILPSVTYNIAIWGNCSANRLDELNHLHAEAARIIFRLPSTSSNDECLKMANWRPVLYLYRKRLLCLMHRIFYQEIDSTIYSRFE